MYAATARYLTTDHPPSQISYTSMPSPLDPDASLVATWMGIAGQVASDLVGTQEQDDLVQDTMLAVWAHRTLVAHLASVHQAAWIELTTRRLATRAAFGSPLEPERLGPCPQTDEPSQSANRTDTAALSDRGSGWVCAACDGTDVIAARCLFWESCAGTFAQTPPSQQHSQPAERSA